MKKILNLLVLILFLIAMPLAAQTFTRNVVDDYTNGKGGTEYETYNFTLNNTPMNAIKNTGSTKMTWDQWLNIKADGFNDLGLGVVDTNSFTAKGLTTYTIKYNYSNGASCSSCNDDLIPEGTTIKLPEPTRTGYTFNGWYTATSGGTKVGVAGGDYRPTSSNTSNQSATLYAQWTANRYEISLNKGTGETSAPITATYDSVVTISNPTRRGYDFTGWTFDGDTSTAMHGASSSSVTTVWNNTDTQTTDQYFKNLTPIPNKIVTLTANWRAKPLVWDIEPTHDFYYSENIANTWKLDAPTGGADMGVTYSGTETDVLSVSSDGIITVKAGTTAGKYQIDVTATDDETGVFIKKTMTVYIMPTIVDDSIEMAYKEKIFVIEMEGISTPITATSESGTLTSIDGGYKVRLNNAFENSGPFKYNLMIVDKEFEYSVNLIKAIKILRVHSATTVFNNEEQIPDFYDENGACETITSEGLSDCIDYYKDQNNLFTWEISGNNLPAGSRTARDVYRIADSEGKIQTYTLTVRVREDRLAHIRILDEDNPNGDGLTEKTVSFNIEPFKITEDNTRIEFGDQTYGNIGEPKVYTTIKGPDEIELIKDQDYEIKSFPTSSTNINAYKFQIFGINNYTGLLENTFGVVEKDISDVSIENIKDQYWTGSEIRPSVSMKYNGLNLIEGTDYTLSYADNINVGIATITITGIGNYRGTTTINFNIIRNYFDKYVRVQNGQAIYTGNATNGGAEVSVSSDLSPKTNYEIKYGTAEGTYNSNSIPTYTDAGTYIVYFKISGEGYWDYTKSLKIVISDSNNTLKIKDGNKEISSTKLIVPDSKTYKFETKFDATVSAESTDFVDVSINNATKEITLTPLKTGSGNITFTAEATGNNINNVSAVLSVKVVNGVIVDNSTNVSGVYTGLPYTFEAKYTPSDATVEYLDERSKTNVGVYVVNYKISKTGYESLTGSRTITIIPKEVENNWTVTLEYTTHEYTGTALKPGVIVKDENNTTLVEGRDYLLSYNNNVMPTDNATVTVTGIGNYSGTIEKTFAITTKGKFDVTTNSYEIEYTSFETNGTKEQRENAVKVTVGNSNITYCTIDTDSKEYKADCTDENNFSVSIPKFKNVGTHIVAVKVTSAGYDTVDSNFTITITKKLLPVPKVSEPDGYLYTGMIQEPTWIGYNSLFVDKIGISKATQPGTYNEIFSLKDPVNTAWLLDSGSQATENQTREWKIINRSIKDHETVVDNYIKYNEWKQLAVEDGKLTFDRTGYTQTGWVEDCTDNASGSDGLYDRNCNYSKFTPFADNSSVTKATCLATGNVWRDDKCVGTEGNSYNTEDSCKAGGHEWYNNKCYTKANLFNVGSTISGAFVAERTNACELINDLDTIRDEYNSRESCEAKGYTWWNNSCYDMANKATDANKTDSYDLFATWAKITYRINYELYDGFFDGSTTTIVSYDQYFTVPNPIKIGYIFTGWTITGMDDTPHMINGVTITDSEYTIPKVWVQNGHSSYKNLTSVDNAVITMSANWEPIEYTLVYDRNKSTYKENAYTTLANSPVTTAEVGGIMSNQTMTYDNPVSIIPNQFWMQGYTFNGWSTSPNGKNSSGASCIVYKHDLEKPYEYVTKDNSQCLTFTNEFMAQTGGNLIQNLTIKDQDEIVMYAQWKQNTDTKFTITYWAQKVGTADDYNSSNYDLIGTETYTGLTDGMVTIQPYWYGSKNQIPDDMSTSELNGTSLNNSSPSDVATKYEITSAAKSGNNNIDEFTIVKIGETSTLENDKFRGFTLQYPQTVESPRNNNQNPNGYNTKLKNTYTYVIKPDGSTNINVYYTRNTYDVTINTNQIDSVANDGNPNTRQYQTSIALQNPLNAILINGSLVNNGAVEIHDAGYKAENNSGLANFQGWYYDNSLTSEIKYIDGEVSKPEAIWAKWYQYRYTGDGSSAWEKWGKMGQ